MEIILAKPHFQILNPKNLLPQQVGYKVANNTQQKNNLYILLNIFNKLPPANQHAQKTKLIQNNQQHNQVKKIVQPTKLENMCVYVCQLFQCNRRIVQKRIKEVQTIGISNSQLIQKNIYIQI
eukprot:TRINITY_DN34256_c0_g1_i1.p4 TRINITY_DN34256_c0_g1~~TRINITY_DN34256_c0_g1_i1.p4  ORF type:complete len:123 (+),score=7.87 TRINITY_DN34256_c0_g1_i1:489-857(+)